jgi:hypothetical protein
VQTRLTSDEACQLQAICTIKGKTRSAYIRSLILRDIREALERREVYERTHPGQEYDPRY